jgi:hypothetical protein
MRATNSRVHRRENREVGVASNRDTPDGAMGWHKIQSELLTTATGTHKVRPLWATRGIEKSYDIRCTSRGLRVAARAENCDSMSAMSLVASPWSRTTRRQPEVTPPRTKICPHAHQIIESVRVEGPANFAETLPPDRVSTLNGLQAKSRLQHLAARRTPIDAPRASFLPHVPRSHHPDT